MRVVHLVPALFGPDGIVGGAERYAFELARHMATRVPTTLVTFGDPRRHETVGSLDVRVLGDPVRPGPADQSVPCPAVRSPARRRCRPLPSAARRHEQRRRLVVPRASAGACLSAISAAADGTSPRMCPPTAGSTAICT